MAAKKPHGVILGPSALDQIPENLAPFPWFIGKSFPAIHPFSVTDRLRNYRRRQFSVRLRLHVDMITLDCHLGNT